MNRIILYCFGDKRCGMVGHIPQNQLLCHDCRFRVIPWKLRIAHYRYTVTRGSAVKRIRLIKDVSYAIKLCAYQMNMLFLFSVCHLVGLVIADTCTGLYTGFMPRGGELGVCQKEGGGNETRFPNVITTVQCSIMYIFEVKTTENTA